MYNILILLTVSLVQAHSDDNATNNAFVKNKAKVLRLR